MDALLELQDIHIYYGAIEAVKGLSLKVPQGKIVALLGSNGAGKTSALKGISGMKKLNSGKIIFDGCEVQNLEPEKITSRRIIQSPEGRQIFYDLTVEENLRLGGFVIKQKKQLEENYRQVYRYFPVLHERKKQIAGTLSGGEQQMLAIGRALMGSPRLLLLDEPSLGLAPLIVRDIFEILKEINAAGVSVLIVEQNALQTLKIADYAYVLELGSLYMQGAAGDLIKDKALVEAYLGTGH